VKIGIQIRRWLPNMIEILTELGVDFVQVPFHIMNPSIEKLQEAKDAGFEIYGKYIPSYELWNKQQSRCRSTINKYASVLSLLDVFGEPETRPGTAGCRWVGKAEELKNAIEIIRGWMSEDKIQILLTGCGWALAVHNPFFGNDDRSIFFDDFLKAGGGCFLDTITLNSWVHGYGGRKNIRSSVLYAQYLLAKYGEPEKKIAISETGASWERTPPQFLHTVQTPEEQANLLVKNIVIMASTGCNGSKTIAYFRLAEMMRILKGSIYIKQIKVFPRAKEYSDDIEWHVFKRPDGNMISVVWSELNNIPLIINDDFEYPCNPIKNRPIMINEIPKFIDTTNWKINL
jgi:hypothetical protein